MLYMLQPENTNRGDGGCFSSNVVITDGSEDDTSDNEIIVRPKKPKGKKNLADALNSDDDYRSDVPKVTNESTSSESGKMIEGETYSEESGTESHPINSYTQCEVL